jgi:hypothetical protein
MSKKWTLLIKSIIFFALFFWGYFANSQPSGLSTHITAFQGARVEVVFNTVDEIQSGKTVSYKTILGLTLSDQNGALIDNFEEMYLYVSTASASISSLNGSSTIPLDRLEITCTPLDGFATAGPIDNFSPKVTLPASNTPILLLDSDRPSFESIAFNTHRVQVEFDLGVTNSLGNASPGLYYITLNFDFQGCGTWGGTCPNP